MQEDRPKYLNPPIRLASCTLYFGDAGGWSNAIAERLHDELGGTYDGLPFVEVPGADYSRANSPSTSISSLILRTKDDSRSVKFSPESIIVRTSAPYDGWEHFLLRIQACTATWQRVVGNTRLSGLSLYYQNLIPLDCDEPEADKYFKIIPSRIDGHFLRPRFYYSSEYVDQRDGGVIDVTLIKFGPRKNETNSLFLLYLDSKSPSFDNEILISQLGEVIDPIKERTNIAFESVITDKMRDQLGYQRRSA